MRPPFRVMVSAVMPLRRAFVDVSVSAMSTMPLFRVKLSPIRMPWPLRMFSVPVPPRVRLPSSEQMP